MNTNKTKPVNEACCGHEKTCVEKKRHVASNCTHQDKTGGCCQDKSKCGEDQK
jgi:hypothetical protein